MRCNARSTGSITDSLQKLEPRRILLTETGARQVLKDKADLIMLYGVVASQDTLLTQQQRTIGASPDGAATERTAAAGHRSEPRRAGPGRAVPEEATGRTVGKLAHSGRSGHLRRPEVQAHLHYWLLVRAQAFTYPDVAWAISAVETGYWYRPPVGHNLYGMKKNARHLYIQCPGGGLLPVCVRSTVTGRLSGLRTDGHQKVQTDKPTGVPGPHLSAVLS